MIRFEEQGDDFAVWLRNTLEFNHISHMKSDDFAKGWRTTSHKAIDDGVVESTNFKSITGDRIYCIAYDVIKYLGGKMEIFG